MEFDLLNLEPTVISRDLRGKYIWLYAKPKIGKTSFAAQIPNNLLLAFEIGYHGIPSLYAVDIEKWSDFKKVLRELRKPEVKEKFKTITIDTVGIAWDLVEKYICSQHGVNKLIDIPWGAGYQMAIQEFETSLREITLLGYGIIFITHSISRVEELEESNVREIVTPDLNKRPYRIINGLVDIISYISLEFQEDGTEKRYLYTRSTPEITAGSRFQYLPTKIEFSYENLVNELVKAIELAASKANIDLLQENKTDFLPPKPNEPTFKELLEESKLLWQDLIQRDPENVLKIKDSLQRIFGGTKERLSEITPDQRDLFELLVMEMRDLSKESIESKE